MAALILALLLPTLFFFAGVFMPGYAVRLRLGGRLPFANAPGDVAVHAMALGLLWCTVQFFIVHALKLDLAGKITPCLLIKLGGDTGLMVLCSLGVAGFWKQLTMSLRALAGRLCDPVNTTGILLATLLACLAVVQFPFAADNAALFWIADAVIQPVATFERAQGSPGYIAWLYWPILMLAPAIPAGTVATGAKLVLNLVAFFCLKRLCQLLPRDVRPRWAPIALFLMLPATMMGDYGLLISAKETPFAVLFLLAGMARWVVTIAAEKPEHAGLEAGPLFSLAFGFGAITIPYLAVFLSLSLLLQPQPALGRSLAAIALWCGIPLSFSLATMLHQPQWLAAITTVAVTGMLWGFRKSISFLLDWWHEKVHGKQSSLALALLPVAIAACWLLLPVEFARTPRAPLDGKSTFAMVFFTSHWATQWYVGAAALMGMFVALVAWRRHPWQPALGAVFVFPFAALLPSLVIARFPSVPLPFHPQHLWDLVKDIPNWIWGPLAIFTALTGLILITSWVCRTCIKSQRWAAVTTTILLLLVGTAYGWHQYGNGRGQMIFRLSQGAYLTKVGGHREFEMAHYIPAMIKVITQERESSQSQQFLPLPLFSSVEARESLPILEFNGCFTDTLRPLSGDEAEYTKAMADHPAPKGFIVANREWLQTFFTVHKPEVEVTELVPPVKGESGTSLFTYVKTPGVPSTVHLGQERAFRQSPPTILQSLGLEPIAVWSDFAATTPRLKDGNPYIWGKQEGTIWVQLPPGNLAGTKLEMRVRFMGESRSKSRLTVSSPLLATPAMLQQESRTLKSTVAEPPASEIFVEDDQRWAPFHFKYEGDLEMHSTLNYLKSYHLDELMLGDAVYLE